jgi:predicted dehydrogenase
VLRVGVIGAGRVAQLGHLGPLAGVEDAQVTALADLRGDLAALVAAHFGIPKVYATHRELLADPEVDAVVVVTQRTQTAGIVGEALRAGKHVLSEKPMAMSTIDATALAELARERGLVYAIGYMKRHDRGIAAAREHIARMRADWSAGTLVLVRATHDGGDDGAGTDWLMTPEPRSDAGFAVNGAVGDPRPRSRFDAFLNVFSHTTNLARFLVDEPIELSAAVSGVRGATVTGHLRGGIPFSGAFVERVVPGWHERVEVIFEHGSVTVDLPPPFDRGGAARISVASRDGSIQQRSLHGWAFERQAHAFVADVTQRRPPLAPGGDAVADVALAESFWRLSGAAAS